MIDNFFLYYTTPANWVLGKLRWGVCAYETKWAFYQENFFHEVVTALHLLTMGMQAVLLSYPTTHILISKFQGLPCSAGVGAWSHMKALADL